MIGKRIAFAGAGGVGKSTTMAALLEMLPEAMIFPSVTRRYYEINGVADEKAFWANLNPTERIEFQIGMLRFYLDSYREVDERAGSRTLICDRSLYCHAGYVIYANPDLNAAQHTEICRLLETFRSVRICLFPYPVPWNSADEFRDTRLGKNLGWHAVVHHLIMAMAAFRYPVPFATIEERARLIKEYWNLK